MLRHRLKTFFVYGFAAYGLVWTLIESISHFFSLARPNGLIQYLFLVLPCLLFGAWRAWPVSSIEITVPNSDSILRIEFGDIWEKNGCVAIQVNEYFDSALGDHVSIKSLHGQFIQNVLRSQSVEFDSLVGKALSSEPFEEVDRPSGKTKCYKIGTTASLDIGPTRYLLYALAKTNINTLKASATIHELWDAYSGLWSAVRISSNGYNVYMPLAGGGLAGVGLPPKNLIQILMTSFSYHTKKQKLTNKLTVVLPKSMSTEIDLRELTF